MRLKYINNIIKTYMNKNYIERHCINSVFYPYIAFNYNEFTFDINEDVLINYYATDYFQSEISEDLTNIQFTLYVNINGNEITQIINIGDNTLNLGKMNKGDYWYTLRIVDLKGNESHSIYGEFRVIDKVADQADLNSKTATITTDILSNYNITLGDYSERTDDNVTITHNTKMGLQNLFNDYATNYRKIILPQGIYTIDVEGVWADGVAIQYYSNLLSIPTRFTVDFNGSEMKQLVSTPDQKVGYMFAINDCYDSHVINCTFTGDYGVREFTPLDGYDYISGEQGGCCTISGKSRYCSIEDCTIHWFPGYVVSAGMQPRGLLLDNYTTDDGHYGEVLTFTEGAIKEGHLETKQGQYLTQLLSLDDYQDFGAFRLGQWLMFLYQPYGDSVLIKVHWYDKNQEYIKTTIEHQYRDIKIIPNAKYIRGEYTFKDYTNIPNQAIIYRHNIPRNCIFKNITFEDTRTCALNPNQGNSLVIDGCTFARCATNITPVAIDFEDGWHNMQDYVLRNCEVLEPVGTADIVIVGGFNLILENNKNWRVSSRGFARGQTYKHNTDLVGNIGLTTHRLSAYCRIDDNTVKPNGGYIGNGLGDMTDIKLYITNCIYPNNRHDSNDLKTIYRDCKFTYDKSSLQYRGGILSGKRYERCTFTDYECTNGHLTNFIAKNSTINNLNVEAFQGEIKLYNCEVNTFIGANYTLDIDMELRDCVITDLQFNRIGYADKANYSIKLINCTIENTLRPNIIDDAWKWGVDAANGKTFRVYIENCTFVGDTVIANNEVFNNDKIQFEIK